MDQFKVSLLLDRDKVCVIKVIRAITGWSLRDTKYYVEDKFCFDSWMSEVVSIEVRLTAEQLGHLTYVSHVNSQRQITLADIERIKTPVDAFDFTNAERP